MRTLLVAIICCSFLIASCRKNRSGSNNLVGKWTLTEMSNIGQAWTKVPMAEQQSFEFRSDSTYIFTPPMISSMAACNGSFNTSSDTLYLRWTCQPPAYNIITVYSINGNTMVLDYIATSTGYKAKYERN